MSAPVFEVFVPDGKWPTFAEVNAALARRGYKMTMVPQAGQTENDPLFHHQYMFKVRFEMGGQDYEEYLEESSAGRFEQAWLGQYADDCEETNERLEECGSPYRVAPGEHVLKTCFSPHVEPRYVVPPVLLNAVMIKDFGGYGFDGEEMKFGRDDFADRMLSWIAPHVRPEGEAPSTSATPVAVPASSSAPLAPAAETLPETQKPKSRWGYWRIILIILLLFLAAEFVDKNIYNFTGTGG